MAKDIKVVMTLDASGVQSGARTAEQALEGVGAKAKSTASEISNVFNAILLGGAAKQLADYADQYQNIKNKLMAFSSSQDEANAKFTAISNIAKATRSDISAVGDMYTKLTITSKELGLSQAQVGKITETFSKALKVSGASTQESASAIRQFGQAMASGKLQGDEFRSLMENSPVFMRKLAESLNLPIGDLKKLGSEGRITAQTMAAATLRMSKDIDEQFGKTVPTIGESLQMIKNSIVVLFGNIQESTGVFSKLAAAIGFVAENIRIVIPLVGVLLVGALNKARIAMIEFAMSNPFTALAMVISVAVGYIWNLIETTGSASNAFKTLGNYGIEAVNMLLNGFAAFFTFMGTMLPTLGKAFVNAINPFSDQSTIDILKNGLSQAWGAARAKLTGEGPIKFRFKLDPVTGAKKKVEESVGDLGAPVLGPGKADKGLDKQLAQAQKIIDKVQDQIDLGKEKLQLELDSIGASELTKKLNEAGLKVEEDRKKAITDINALEKLSADARANYIDAANQKFDELKKNTLDGLKQIDEAQKTFAFGKTLAAIGEQGQQTLKQFQQQQQLDRELSQARRTNMAENFAIENDYNNKAIELRQKYKDLTDPDYIAELQRLEQIRIARLASVKPVQAERVTTENKNREFGTGVQKSMDVFFNNLEDEAAYGQRLFQTMTDGWSNSILNFVQTGKLSFGDLFRSLMAEVIKMQANRLFASILGGLFGGGAIFGEFAASAGIKIPGRASGGAVSANTPYLVGEKGMELFIPRSSGSIVNNGQLSMMGNNEAQPTQVVYNIQATDAMSFRQMLARDPEFLYGLTEQSRRSLPVRRRQ